MQYAPNQLLNLPDFKPFGEPENVKMSGFDAIQSAGTYTDDGIARVVAQKTIVIPGKTRCSFSNSMPTPARARRTW